MADELDALLARVDDEALRRDLAAQITKLRQKRQFGLVFEEHLPERVALPQHGIRRGTKVVRRDGMEDEQRVVLRVRSGHAMLAGPDGEETVPVEDLVAVAEFGEPIYPGLKRLGSIERGGDKPAHVVIKGENYHALEALQFTHAGKVDCIYIDPPYNTGARDWKYNNDYVDGDDAYRHSKWLAFMQRRLLLAKKLLNPEDSVLIVTIDEKERSKLELLLEQTFRSAEIQMATAVTNHAGSTRPGRLSRVEENIFFAFFGDAVTARWITSMLEEAKEDATTGTLWFSAIRTGPGSALREARPNLFYPVHLDGETGDLLSVGEPLEPDEPIDEYQPPAGATVLWPLATSGREQTWRFSSSKMREFLAAGTARLGQWNPETKSRPITYMRPGTLRKIEEGTFVVTGRDQYGGLEVALADGAANTSTPATVWNLRSHFARDYGTKLNRRFIPGRDFPYPKSLYAVEDTLRVAVGSKPNAIVLDFFVGSGTTAHAVARLNRQDGGTRRSIVVTNNEVSEEEARRLAAAGHRTGDAAWERLGIFEYITRPRIQAAITGITPEGEPVNGDYKFTDEFPMAEGFEENVEFVELEYLDAEAVELDKAFEAIAPLLWIRAGSVGPVLTESHDSAGRRKPYVMSEHYAVLFNSDRWRTFVEKLPESLTHVFVVTDSASEFANVAAELPDGVDVVRLYENYLSTFAINTGAGS